MKNPKTYWDSFDGLYQMGPQSHRVYLLDLLTEKGVESFLDVGCGTGPLYELIFKKELNPVMAYIDGGFGGATIKRWNFKYKGTDYAEGMIQVCKREFPEGNWEVQDARKLKEADNSWDAVVLMHSLDHLDDYQSAIKEAARVARKYVLIVLWRGLSANDENNLNDRSSYGRDDGKLWEDTHLQDYSEKKLRQAFKDAGLEVELETNGPEINKEGKFNTLFLLKKND